MMFNKDFVAVVKVGGKILREDGPVVQIPFGSEYSILMKNLRAVQAVASISIDGEDVLGGRQLIVPPNGELELERFLKDLNEGHRFKFIQKTKQIQDHRGDKIDDGIVRVKFQFEKPPAVSIPITRYTYPNPITPKTWYGDGSTITSGQITTGTITTGQIHSSNCEMSKLAGSNTATSLTAQNTSFTISSGLENLRSALPKQDEGVTVGGSKSSQQFRQGWVGVLEEAEYVITLQLKGCKADGTAVATAVTVQEKKQCRTCGRKAKSSAKFCPECGTALDW